MIFSEMVLLALLSMVPGAAASWAVNAYLARWGFPLPHSFTYGGMVYSTLYGHVSWVEFVVPGVLILCTAVLVSLPAAWRVWRLTPLEALRKA
jgi:ABC-type lipoprotein release transport system permease subunit